MGKTEISGNFYIKGNGNKSFQHINFCSHKNQIVHPFTLNIKYKGKYTLYGKLTYFGREFLNFNGFRLINSSGDFYFKHSVKIITTVNHAYEDDTNICKKAIEFEDDETIKRLYQFICDSSELQIEFIFYYDSYDSIFPINDNDSSCLKEIIEKYFSLQNITYQVPIV